MPPHARNVREVRGRREHGMGGAWPPRRCLRGRRRRLLDLFLLPAPSDPPRGGVAHYLFYINKTRAEWVD